LTTRAFAELKANPKIGRAEAFRLSMKGLIQKGSLADAHPTMWAPFVVVGEGGAVNAGDFPPSIGPIQAKKNVAKPAQDSPKDWATEFLKPRGWAP
jgi:hypothetical protein